jgi:hypothetical protein
MQIENFHLTIGKIVPEFDGEFSEDVNVHATARGIRFDKIRKILRISRDFAEAFEQVALFARTPPADGRWRDQRRD